MRINLTSLCLVILCNYFTGVHCQSEEKLNSILRGNQEVPEILLVGTFHFGYPGLDPHKTDEAYKIDITSPQRQKEVEDLVDYIAQYKPTKILVESGANTGYLMERYRKWKSEGTSLRKREIDQVGFRLMKQFKIDTIYGIDANSFARDYSRSKDSVYTKPIFEKIYQQVPDSLTASATDANYWNWYDIQDMRCLDMPLLDYFKEMNSDHHIKRMHGHYILRDKTENYNAVDGLALNWYSRNLRIMKNIHMIETNPKDRLLVLIGAGHVSILKQQFESNPEYELISFSNLESKGLND